MPVAPILVENAFAIGTLAGRPVRGSIIKAAAAVLFCRGADELIVPAPTAEVADDVEQAVLEMPDERRPLVRIVDRNGKIGARVQDYLDPLQSYARKWPEDAFVNFLYSFLYHLLVATNERAAIANDTLQTVREFVPIIDVNEFRGEARYRLAEIVSVIAAYEPVEATHGIISAPVVEQASRDRLTDIIDSAEFRRLTATSGLLGYLTEPRVALRRIARLFRNLVGRQPIQAGLSVAVAAGEAGAVKPIAKGVGKLLELANQPREFAPPFLPLGSAEIGIYRTVIADISPEAKPHPGTAVTFQHARELSWLNVGEEPRIYAEERDIAGRAAKAAQCREVQKRFF
jgi:hypothetical protein